jgi:hypothetical protein
VAVVEVGLVGGKGKENGVPPCVGDANADGGKRGVGEPLRKGLLEGEGEGRGLASGDCDLVIRRWRLQ